MSVRIILADDHRIMREGLAALVEKQSDMKVIGQASDGRQAVQLARDLQPDVIIMDASMPVLNGIEATCRIAAELPDIRVLCLSFQSNKRLVLAVLEAGASGYLLKDCAAEELITAIRTVMNNQTYLSPAVAGTVVDGYKARRPDAKNSAFTQLTEREREIVQLLAEGMSTKEIAAQLHLSVKTVGTHREHLQAKLHMHNLAELTKYALREGLTSVDS
jgi:DNA-binding NarL/FixJ family response regulator